MVIQRPPPSSTCPHALATSKLEHRSLLGLSHLELQNSPIILTRPWKTALIPASPYYASRVSEGFFSSAARASVLFADSPPLPQIRYHL